MASTAQSTVNLGLPAIPESTDPKLFQEFVRIYNAIKIIAQGLDDYTGEGSAPSDLLSLQNQITAITEILVSFNIGPRMIYIKDATVLAAGTNVQGTAVGLATKREITNMLAFNGTAATITLDVYNVPGGELPTASNAVLHHDVLMNESYLCPPAIGIGMNVDGRIYASGTGLSFSYVANDTAT